MGVVSSVYKSTSAKNSLHFASSQETPATNAINHAIVSATPINHTYSPRMLKLNEDKGRPGMNCFCIATSQLHVHGVYALQLNGLWQLMGS